MKVLSVELPERNISPKEWYKKVFRTELNIERFIKSLKPKNDGKK